MELNEELLDGDQFLRIAARLGAGIVLGFSQLDLFLLMIRF